MSNLAIVPFIFVRVGTLPCKVGQTVIKEARTPLRFHSAPFQSRNTLRNKMRPPSQWMEYTLHVTSKVRRGAVSPYGTLQDQEDDPFIDVELQ